MTTHHSQHSTRARAVRDAFPAPEKRKGGIAAEDGRLYGSGGSYGYGGAFQHGGQRGYDVSFAEQKDAQEPESEREDEQDKFGYDTDGYARQGIGHPGKEERRPRPERAGGAPDAQRSPAEEDARKGYSQESGYAQSGGNPTPGGGKARSKRSS